MEEPQTNKQELPSAFSLFKPSFDALLVNIWTFLALLLVPLAGLMLVIPFAIAGKDQPVVAGAGIVVGIIAMTFFLFVAPSLPYVQLRSVQGKEVSLGDALGHGKKFFWRFYGESLLVGLLTLIGFILFIVPGLLILKRYYLATYYMYDQDLGILESMRRAAADAKTFSGAVWGLIGVTFLIQLPSVIPLFALITIVLVLMYYCAPPLRYLQIKAAAGKQTS